MKLHKALNRMREMHEAYNHASTEDSKRLAAWRDEVIALRDERDRLARAIVWALGYTDFRAREHDEGPYWWRTELRLRAKLTGEQIDAILAALTPAGGRAG